MLYTDLHKQVSETHWQDLHKANGTFQTGTKKVTNLQDVQATCESSKSLSEAVKSGNETGNGRPSHLRERAGEVSDREAP